MITPPIQDELDVLATEELEEINIFLKQVMESMMPAEVKVKCLAMLNRLKKLVKYGSFSKEFEPVEQYLSWILKVPWGKYTSDNLDLALAKTQLDKTHYGLEEVKERIMEYIAVLNLLSKQDSGAIANPTTSPKLYSGNYKSKAPVICFVGVQGIGKTSIAKSIAAALGRQFNRIPLGGLADIKELRGVNKSQINAEPGQVIKSFVRTGVMNPLILLDELDKVSSGGGVNADIMAALLEILDPEQNANFTDYYLDFPVDLSKCVFIATANNLGGISAALLDRLEIIRMTSYTDDEKIHIAKDYLLPKILDQCGLKNDNLVFEEEVWPLIVRPFGFDAGMRQLERNLNQVIRKVAKRILVENATSYKVTTVNFREFFPQDIGVYS
jgi:ATP-dependent Lon protease